MRVKFICHSGFYIEGEKNCLIFDYWKGALPKIPADKRLWIFASHHHPDQEQKRLRDRRCAGRPAAG